MNEPFDFVINAEVIVGDVALAERVLVDALGFPQQRSSWGQQAPGKGFTFLFARVHPSLAVSPTRVEAMAVAPLDPHEDPDTTLAFLPALLDVQQTRPWKTHGNELATSDIEAVAQRLRTNGCPFFRMPGNEAHPFTRLWIGWTEENPGAYRPDADGGLMLEICETPAVVHKPDFWDRDPQIELPPGAMLRVVERTWLVEDLQRTLGALEQHFGWRPETRNFEAGCDRAAMGVNHPRSARLVLLQPTEPGEAQDAFQRWGPGAWTIRIGVNDLVRKAADLTERGTPFIQVPIQEREALRVDTAPLGIPGIFEFIEI